jgi:hypothetical protein
VAEAARYDAVDAVWIAHHRHAQAEEIGKAIQRFHELHTALRENFRKANAELAKAEAEKKTAEIKRLKAEREVARKAQANALKAAKEHGHRDVLEHLGDNHKLVLGLTGTLIDCFKLDDFNGQLPKSVLGLMAKFRSLSDDLLKKVKFDGVAKRFMKKGDDEVKGYITAINKNTTEAQEKAKKVKKETEKEERSGIKVEGDKQRAREQPKISQAGSAITASSATNLKRPHEGDGINGKPAKKVASDLAGTSSIPKSSSVAAAAKTAPVRSNNIFASLTRPGLKSAAAKAAPPKAAPKKETQAPSSQQASLASILASIEAPKEVKKAPVEPQRPPETPEEKKKRERKESRRHLRVRFREGADLVQIKLFKHEQAEDEGRRGEMLRDAHDDRSEGMMHKQRVLETMDEDAMDEDDDLSREVEFRPYPGLTHIDRTDVNQRQLKEIYTSKGGLKEFSTEQQKVQAHREATELMAFYTDDSQIPNTAQEPQDPYSGVHQDEIPFGQSIEPKFVQKTHEIQQHGPERALAIWSQRSEQRRQQALHNGRPQNFVPTSANISAILADLKPTSQNITPNSTHQPFPASHLQPNMSQSNENRLTEAAMANLLHVVASLKDKPYPADSPPDWMTENGKAMWWEGYYRDHPEKWVAVQASQHAQVTQQLAYQPQQQAQMAQSSSYQHLSAPTGASPAVPSELLDFLSKTKNHPDQGQAGLTQRTSQQQTPQPFTYQYPPGSAASMPMTPEMQELLARVTNGAPQQWPSNFPNIQHDQLNAARQNWPDATTAANFADFQSGGNRNWEEHKPEEVRAEGGKRKRPNFGSEEYKKAKVGTKPCKYFSEGKCLKGDKCTYRHDV